ncbi:CRE-NPR-16 protein [Aphelenchoides avenae]|nr:CRE-NPR-16 protein [Aphelenchus avenae]
MHGPIHETSANPARLGVTILHLILVVVGTINLLIIFVILVRPTIRTITNVYIVSLCLANFIYLINLTLVVATQFNDKSWPFGATLCHIYHGTETTGKYASVLFVVLLAADRYAVMCQPDFCARYRSYSRAVRLSIGAWIIAIAAASPLYIFSRVGVLVDDQKETYLCIASWPTIATARWYIGLSSVFVFAVPLALIVFCYYNIINKLRNAAKGRMRLANRLGAKRRSPYHKVTLLVLWVVVFHVLCWSPFWFFNLLSAIFRLRITTHYDRLLINFIHLLPYFNCALNPIVYAVQAENVRTAFSALSWRSFKKGGGFFDMKDRNQSTYRRTKSQPLLLLMAKPSRDGKEKVKANRKSLSYPPQTPSKHSAVEERSCEEIDKDNVAVAEH